MGVGKSQFEIASLLQVIRLFVVVVLCASEIMCRHFYPSSNPYSAFSILIIWGKRQTARKAELFQGFLSPMSPPPVPRSPLTLPAQWPLKPKPPCRTMSRSTPFSAASTRSCGRRSGGKNENRAHSEGDLRAKDLALSGYIGNKAASKKSCDFFFEKYRYFTAVSIFLFPF